MILETQRLLLRPIEQDDAQDIFAYASEPDVGPNAGWKPHENLDETLEIIETVFLHQQAVFGIVLKETGTMVGSIGLVGDPKRQNEQARMLGYALSAKQWGRGYMTEAAAAVVRHGFETMGLDLISAYCYPLNERSQRVLDKLGFQYEGRLAQCEQLYTGEVLDNECYRLDNPQRN